MYAVKGNGFTTMMKSGRLANVLLPVSLVCGVFVGVLIPRFPLYLNIHTNNLH